jgi:hypothetical protein
LLHLQPWTILHLRLFLPYLLLLSLLLLLLLWLFQAIVCCIELVKLLWIIAIHGLLLLLS